MTSCWPISTGLQALHVTASTHPVSLCVIHFYIFVLHLHSLALSLSAHVLIHNMSDKSHSTTAQEVRSILSQRVAGYQILLLDNLTPLFHKELQDATKLHEEILERPDPTISEQQRTLTQLAHLDSIDAQLMEHWKDLHTSLISRTALLANIMAYQGFLATSILLDYAGHSPREAGLESWVSGRVETLDKHYSTGDKNDKDIRLYQQMVATPIKEMMLDQAHVEKRIRTAAAEPYPTGEIYRLIDECDWSNLATMLINDRKLAETLHGQKPLDPKSYNDKTSKIVLRKMDEIRDTYFTDLSAASTYTPSKHAKDLSARKAAGLHIPSELNRYADGDWAVPTAKGVFNKVLGSLGLGAGTSPTSAGQSGSSRASSRLSTDSKTQLLASRNK